MVRRLAIVVALFLASTVLPFAPDGHARALPFMGPRDSVGTLTFGGLARSYVVHLPDSYTGASTVPLLVVLHGGNGTGEGMISLTHLSTVADRHGFIVVYPNGYQNGWADGRGVTSADQRGVDDVGFIMALIAALEKRYEVDVKAVGVAGISNGGFMAQRLACANAGHIAIIAAVAATLMVELSPQCHPARPIPALFFHGTADPLVPYAGGPVAGVHDLMLSSDATVQRWAALDGCRGAPAVMTRQQQGEDGTGVQVTSYTTCADKAVVERFSIIGGGHTWPGGRQYLPVAIIGKTSREIDASEVIWSFLREHPLT